MGVRAFQVGGSEGTTGGALGFEWRVREMRRDEDRRRG